MDLSPVPATTKLGDLAEAAGLRRVHVLAWRDLADVEAGGSEIHAAEIASRWAAAGIDVVMRTSHAQGHLSDEYRDGYRVIRRAGRHLVFLDAPLQELLRRAGRRDGLVDVWNGVPFFTPVWARGPRIAFVHHVHADMWRQSVSPRLAPLGEAIELRIAPRVYRRTLVVTPSPSSREDIIRRLRLNPERVQAVPNGVHPRFTPGGTRAGQPVILFVGRHVPHKRIDDLIRATAEVRADVPHLALRIVGDGYARPTLEQLVDDLDARAWVTFTGRVDDDELVDHYRRAWVVASASNAEGWGLTLAEAAACGTATVATRIPGHVDVVDHGVSGLLADPRDFAAALRDVLTQPGLRFGLEAGGIRRAASLSWDRTAHGVLAALAAEAARRD
jgi:glycosyltransferase involved in cell wall biosynthesis